MVYPGAGVTAGGNRAPGHRRRQRAQAPDLADARERTCFVVARELLANKGLSDQTYAAAEKTMGLEGLVALVASTGSFSMTCMTANTFGIDPPPENPTPLAE